MRTIIYAIFNKETHERVFTDCRLAKVNEAFEALENKEMFVIRHNWMSI